MAYVTKPFTHEFYYVPGHPKYQPTGIIVNVLKENKRPVGYAPWPDEPQHQVEVETKRKKRKKKRN